MIAPEDIVPGIAAEIAVNATGPGRVQVKWKSCGDRKADDTVERIIRALVAKHLRGTNNKGKRVDARKICRELVLDVLSRKKSVAPYHGIITGFCRTQRQGLLPGVWATD